MDRPIVYPSFSVRKHQMATSFCTSHPPSKDPSPSPIFMAQWGAPIALTRTWRHLERWTILVDASWEISLNGMMLAVGMKLSSMCGMGTWRYITMMTKWDHPWNPDLPFWIGFLGFEQSGFVRWVEIVHVFFPYNRWQNPPSAFNVIFLFML